MYSICHRRPKEPLEYQRRPGESQSTADRGEQALKTKHLLRSADADTDVGCLAMQGMSSRSLSDTVTRHCPPPDSDRGWKAVQLMLGRPDSDACLLLPDSSLSQPNEHDPLVLLAEDESSCKLVLISASNTGGKCSFYQQVLPWERGMSNPDRKVEQDESNLTQIMITLDK